MNTSGHRRACLAAGERFLDGGPPESARTLLAGNRYRICGPTLADEPIAKAGRADPVVLHSVTDRYGRVSDVIEAPPECRPVRNDHQLVALGDLRWLLPDGGFARH